MKILARLGALALGALSCAALAQNVAYPPPNTGTVALGFGAPGGPIKNVDDGHGLPTTPPRVSAASYSAVFSTANSAATLIPASPTRAGLVIQNQSTGRCWINGSASAAEDQTSFRLEPGDTYETTSHVGTGAVSIICNTANAPVYARAW